MPDFESTVTNVKSIIAYVQNSDIATSANIKTRENTSRKLGFKGEPQGPVFTTLPFLRNLRMSPISIPKQPNVI